MTQTQNARKRIVDVERDLIEEFESMLDADTVRKELEASLSQFEQARLTEFVPLFVHRETRRRLFGMARSRTARAP